MRSWCAEWRGFSNGSSAKLHASKWAQIFGNVGPWDHLCWALAHQICSHFGAEEAPLLILPVVIYLRVFCFTFDWSFGVQHGPQSKVQGPWSMLQIQLVSARDVVCAHMILPLLSLLLIWKFSSRTWKPFGCQVEEWKSASVCKRGKQCAGKRMNGLSCRIGSQISWIPNHSLMFFGLAETYA